jgi:hypothetical protein
MFTTLRWGCRLGRLGLGLGLGLLIVTAVGAFAGAVFGNGNRP